ncbi:YoaK family protein [Pseudoduganella sp. LjRoot289]|uniref:YoaK family protein n=1 Tax=Pseudoduganella sp. LjRoot289 TaxID=3342314 RepID=UPI003ECF6EBE
MADGKLIDSKTGEAAVPAADPGAAQLAARQAGRQAVALGFIAGYVDTLGFVALFGLFTAHVTGNFVLIGSELARPGGSSVTIKFLAFASFVAAVALTRLYILWLERGQAAPLRSVLWLQLVLLLGFMLAGLAALPLTASDTPLALLAGTLGAAAMGVQNAAAKLLLANLTPTTVMTGNVTQLVIDLVDILRGGADTSIHRRCAKFLWPILAFGVGCAGGAFGFVYAGFYGLLLPAALLAWLALRAG